MTIEVLKEDFTVCKLEEGQPFDFESEFSFLSVTDEEIREFQQKFFPYTDGKSTTMV